MQFCYVIKSGPDYSNCLTPVAESLLYCCHGNIQAITVNSRVHSWVTYTVILFVLYLIQLPPFSCDLFTLLEKEREGGRERK